MGQHSVRALWGCLGWRLGKITSGVSICRQPPLRCCCGSGGVRAGQDLGQVRLNPCNAKKGVNWPRSWVRRAGVKPRGPAQLSQETWGPSLTPERHGGRLLRSHRPAGAGPVTPLGQAAGWGSALGAKHPEKHLQQLLFGGVWGVSLYPWRPKQQTVGGPLTPEAPC